MQADVNGLYLAAAVVDISFRRSMALVSSPRAEYSKSVSQTVSIRFKTNLSF
jgi:hypothetical protein